MSEVAPTSIAENFLSEVITYDSLESRHEGKEACKMKHASRQKNNIE